MECAVCGCKIEKGRICSECRKEITRRADDIVGYRLKPRRYRRQAE